MGLDAFGVDSNNRKYPVLHLQWQKWRTMTYGCGSWNYWPLILVFQCGTLMCSLHIGKWVDGFSW